MDEIERELMLDKLRVDKSVPRPPELTDGKNLKWIENCWRCPSKVINFICFQSFRNLDPKERPRVHRFATCKLTTSFELQRCV